MYTHAHARIYAPHDQEPGPAAVPIRSLALLAYVAAGVEPGRRMGKAITDAPQSDLGLDCSP